MRTRHNDKTNGMRLALLIYLVTFCAVFAGFASVLYAALQPTKLTNPGLSAYKAPAGTALYSKYVPPEPETQVAAEASVAPPPAPVAAQEKQRPAKQARQKTARPQRVARQRYDRSPSMMGYTAMGYAAPPNGYFRPWF